MFDQIAAFIERWKPSGGSEVANFQLFASELTDILDVERINPTVSDGQTNSYRFERPVTFTHTGKESRGRIDLYRKDCLILEAKQGGNWQKATDKNQMSLSIDEQAPIA